MKRIVVFALVLNAALLGVIAHQLVAIAGGGAVATQNGDTNGDGNRDITDAIYYLSWLFQGGAEPVAIAQQGGDGEEVAQLRAQFAALRADTDDLQGQVEDCCDQRPGWIADLGGFDITDIGDEEFGAFQLGDENGFNLHHMNFEGANLRGANLSWANLVGANLRDADLSLVRLRYARLPGADLRGANLRGADLFDADLGSANLQGVIFEGVNFDEGQFYFANFRDADLSGEELRWVSLVQANFQDADLQGTNLEGADLHGANLQGANLQGAYLQRANLEGTNLEGTNIQDADLRDARNVNLEGTIGTPAFMPDDPLD